MKPFDPTLYQANDSAKYAAIELLEAKGWTAEVNPDQYGIDILARKGEETLSLEVEVKHNWTGDRFPFSTLQIPERKTKFAGIANAWFMVINSDRTKALLTSGQSVLSSPLVEVSNRLVQSGEKFYQIPMEQVREITL